MKSVLVVHGGAEGHAADVAAFVADALNARGVKMVLVDAGSRIAQEIQPIHSAAILCGALPPHGHDAALQRFVRENREWLAGLPVAFVAAAPFDALADERGRREASASAEAYFRKTDWSPAITRLVGVAPEPGGEGALRRVMVRLFGGRRAAPAAPDAADHDALVRLVDEFLGATSQEEGGH
jgi:menaquinone-dependent protoporphyrinogen IX oxidase